MSGMLQHASAQSLAISKASQRYEVDAKRIGVDVNSDDALPRSREFKRIDSTYYVGWLFEGAYKFNHAADYLGFKNAAVPLERALALMDRDYRKQLSTRTTDLLTYMQVYKYHIDYTIASYFLMNCYSNMEEPDKVYYLLRRIARYNFQRDWFMDAYNYLGWTVHRNRFYTTAKYPFLKNSIDENERLAQRYLDSGMRKINRDMVTNAHIFQPGYEKADKLGVYHYKSMLYSYALKIDSAAYYYGLMKGSPIFSHNNYGTFLAICGAFRDAEAEYQLEAARKGTDKRLQEWVYYTAMLDVYKGLPKPAAELSRGMIRANGSTPGFGWYNIALGRSLLYDGQVAEASRYINKASQFKELHIGTTLGQTHYDFSIQLLKLVSKQHEVEAKKFENRNWWYNPNVLGSMAQLVSEKYLQQFLIINQFAQNPERDRVIYKLFSSESTVSWDEVWYLIRDFSTQYFLDRFRRETQEDERRYIRKYFNYFVARLQMKKGHYKEANLLLNEVLNDPTIDPAYEKLLIARSLQAQAECAEEMKNDPAYHEKIYSMYIVYPQLIPYTGLKMDLNLTVAGTPDKELLDRLKGCNINWVAGNAPKVYLSFSGAGNKKRVEYSVVDGTGNYIVRKQSMSYKQGVKGAIDLAYRLFNIGGSEAEPASTKEKQAI
jgi:Tfp pilus assembly protein PilF